VAVLVAARWLGHMTTNPKWGKIFPLIYTAVVFFMIPGVCYGRGGIDNGHSTVVESTNRARASV